MDAGGCRWVPVARNVVLVGAGGSKCGVGGGGSSKCGVGGC